MTKDTENTKKVSIKKQFLKYLGKVGLAVIYASFILSPASAVEPITAAASAEVVGS